MSEQAYTAAWVPDDDPERSWDEAADLAVGWLLNVADEEVPPVLYCGNCNQRV